MDGAATGVLYILYILQAESGFYASAFSPLRRIGRWRRRDSQAKIGFRQHLVLRNRRRAALGDDASERQQIGALRHF